MTPSTEAEVTALWTAVFGEPPSVTASATLMLAILVDQLQHCPPYRPAKAPLDLADPAPLYCSATQSMNTRSRGESCRVCE